MVGIPWICSISRTELPTQIWTTEDRYRQQSFRKEYSIRRISTSESQTSTDVQTTTISWIIRRMNGFIPQNGYHSTDKQQSFGQRRITSMISSTMINRSNHLYNNSRIWRTQKKYTSNTTVNRILCHMDLTYHHNIYSDA